MNRVLGMTIAGAAMVLSSFAGTAQAQFYEGKRITVLVNYSAGGTTDTVARLASAHLGKHLPGAPDIVVKNMPGAGGITATNHMGEVARPDGLTIAIFAPPLMQQLLQDPALLVDLSRFSWLAGLGHPQVCFIRSDAGTGVTGVDDLPTLGEFNVAGYRPTTSTDIRMRMALDLLGVEYKYVTGYRGASKVVAAIMQNEAQYSCISTLGFRKLVEPNLIEPGHGIALWYNAVVGPDGKQARDTRVEGLPTFIDVHERLKGRKPSGMLYRSFETVNNLMASVLWASFAPAGTPDEAVDALGAAWQALATDEDFIADYVKVTKGPPAVLDAAATQAHVEKMASIDPEMVAFMKEFVGAQ